MEHTNAKFVNPKRALQPQKKSRKTHHLMEKKKRYFVTLHFLEPVLGKLCGVI